MRFSLRSLFGAVLLAAIASMSLVYASRPLSDALAAALVAFLVVAVIGSKYGRGRRAAFWGGCAIAGWAYLLCLWFTMGQIDANYPLPTLIVDRGINRLYDVVSRELPAEPINGELSAAYYVNGKPVIRVPMLQPFAKAGHSLVSFLAALLGGAVGRMFYGDSGAGRPDR